MQYPDVPVHAAELLQSARAASHLTQPQLEQRSGVPQATISRYEARRQDPPFTTLQRLLLATGHVLPLRLQPVEKRSLGLGRLRPPVRQDGPPVAVAVLVCHELHELFTQTERAVELASDYDLFVIPREGRQRRMLDVGHQIALRRNDFEEAHVWLVEAAEQAWATNQYQHRGAWWRKMPGAEEVRIDQRAWTEAKGALTQAVSRGAELIEDLRALGLRHWASDVRKLVERASRLLAQMDGDQSTQEPAIADVTERRHPPA